jgi:uncharacterized protein
LFEGTYTFAIVRNFIDLFIDLGPYLLISIAINVWALRWFDRSTIRFSRKKEGWSILSASLLGLVSPLPTYAAIPIAVSLLPTGIPFSAIISFSVSSPLINPSIFFLTATQLGLAMAMARTTAALLMGLLSGLAAMKLFDAEYKAKNVFRPLQGPDQKRGMAREFYRNGLYVFKTFAVAILISAAVKALVSPEQVACLLGRRTSMTTLAAMALGVPFYSCGGAAIPFIQTLMDMGMNKGAVLAFFIAGPATKLETVYAFKKILGLKVLFLYLALTLTFSYLAGMIYSSF